MPDAHPPQAEDIRQHAGRASSPPGRAGTTRSRQDMQNAFLEALRRTASLMQLMGQAAADHIGINHGRLKARLRPMRGLKRHRSARIVSAGHAFVQNLRRGHYELATDVPARHRIHAAFDQLAMSI